MDYGERIALYAVLLYIVYTLFNIDICRIKCMELF